MEIRIHTDTEVASWAGGVSVWRDPPPPPSSSADAPLERNLWQSGLRGLLTPKVFRPIAFSRIEKGVVKQLF